jgi:hypothetical protein
VRGRFAAPHKPVGSCAPNDSRLHTVGADGTNPRVLRAGSEADW